MSDKIISFPGNDIPDNPIQLENQKDNWCKHAEVALDVHSRMVNCRQCGATLEPFNFLLKNFQTLQNAWSNHAYVTQKTKDANARLEVINKEIKRLSGKVKRMQEKEKVDGPIFNVREP